MSLQDALTALGFPDGVARYPAPEPVTRFVPVAESPAATGWEPCYERATGKEYRSLRCTGTGRVRYNGAAQEYGPGDYLVRGAESPRQVVSAEAYAARFLSAAEFAALLAPEA